MKRIIFITFVLAFLVSCKSEIKEKKDLNFIVIITDDQARSEFNFLPEGKNEDGSSKSLTSNIDKLASTGIIFSNFYASSSLCTPSRYSILTGQYASRAIEEQFIEETKRNGGQTSIQWNTFISKKQKSLASILQENGYYTGYVGKNHQYRTPDIENHIITSKVPRDADPSLLKYDSIFKNNINKKIDAIKEYGYDFAASIYDNNMDGGSCHSLEVHNMDWITKGAVDFIDEASKSNKPLFLYLATTLSHYPKTSDKGLFANPLATPGGLLSDTLTVQQSRQSVKKRCEASAISPEKYHLTWLDDGIGAILKKLEQKDELENTVIVYFNDHGNELGKGSVYEGGVKSFGFIWGTQAKGIISEAKVANIDITPTILDLAGIDSDQNLLIDGKSIIPIIENKKSEIRDYLYFESGNTRAIINNSLKYIAFRNTPYINEMTLDERTKLLQTITERLWRDSRYVWPVTDPSLPFGHSGYSPGGTAIELAYVNQYPAYFDADQLYNLKTDPREKNNLASNEDFSGQLVKMKNILSKQLNDLPGFFGELKPME